MIRAFANAQTSTGSSSRLRFPFYEQIGFSSPILPILPILPMLPVPPVRLLVRNKGFQLREHEPEQVLFGQRFDVGRRIQHEFRLRDVAAV